MKWERQLKPVTDPCPVCGNKTLSCTHFVQVELCGRSEHALYEWVKADEAGAGD